MAELHRVTIDGVEYDLPSGGGGGSSVIPNPEGTPTAKLEKLQIEDTIFNIESGTTDVDWRDISGKPEFANVATSGSYNDLSHKPELSTVATTGSYDDLINKPVAATDIADKYTNVNDILTKKVGYVLNCLANEKLNIRDICDKYMSGHVYMTGTLCYVESHSDIEDLEDITYRQTNYTVYISTIDHNSTEPGPDSRYWKNLFSVVGSMYTDLKDKYTLPKAGIPATDLDADARFNLYDNVKFNDINCKRWLSTTQYTAGDLCYVIENSYDVNDNDIITEHMEFRDIYIAIRDNRGEYPSEESDCWVKWIPYINDKISNINIIEAGGTNFELATSEGGLLIKHMEGASIQDGTPTFNNPVEIKSADVNITSRTTNILPFPYYSSSGVVNNGITYTINADGSVTANGTATAISRFYFYTASSISFAGKRVRLSGCPSGGSKSSYAIYTQGNNQFDYGDGCIFDYESNMSGLAIVVYGGATVNSLIFNPMLTEVAEDGTYPTKYAPPFKTTADTSITLRAIGDVKDELQFGNDKFQIVRRIGYADLGDYTYSYSPTNGTGDTTISGAKIQPIIGEAGAYSKSNKYVYSNVTIATMQDGDYRLHTANTSRYVFKNSNYTSASAYKAGLAGTKFQYLLETPTIEEISNEDAIKLLGLKSWEDTTYLIQNNECNGAITLMYGSTPETAKNIQSNNQSIANKLSNPKSTISDEWLSTKTYAQGEYCISNNQLWKSNVDNNLGNVPTEGSYWTVTSICNELIALWNK